MQMMAMMQRQQQQGYMPRAANYTPFTGMEGMPNLFGGGGFNMAAQMFAQNMLASQMSNMGMAPMGLSDINMLDRLRDQRFTQSHNAFVTEQAELDRNNYMRTARGVANLFGTPWGANQQAAAQTIASGVISMSPMLTQMAPMALDEFSGQRGSAAVMAHYMHVGGKHRIDPVTGKMGISDDNLKELMTGVYDNMFAGDKYMREPLSAGRAGMLFQELQMRGMMPGASSLEMLQRSDPGRMQELYSRAGIDNDRDERGRLRSVKDLSASERDALMAVPEVQTDLKAFDSKRVTGTLQDWGKALEAMREIFGDAGYPNAPMPVLIQSLNSLTGGGMGQLNPGQIADIVRTTANLASQSGIGMEAATMMTQQAAQQAAALGLDPVFGARAAQHSMAFTSAYQGMGVGAYNAWGRGDILEHQALNQQLFLQGAASQAANQMAVAMRLDELENFEEGTDAHAFLQAVLAGQTEFRDKTGKMRSTDLEEEDFAAMIEASGRASSGQTLFMLQQTAANQEYLFRNPEALQAVRQLQGREFIARQADVAAASAYAFTAEQGVDAEKMSGLLDALGEDAISAFMGSNGDVATDRERRNQAMADAMRQRIKDQAAAGDEGAKELLDSFGGDDAKFDKYLTDMAENMYGSVDQHLRDTGQGTLQNRHALHNTPLLRRAAREQGRARVRAMIQESMAPIGKGTMLRRGMEALMKTGPDEDKPVVRILAEAMGGVHGDKIATALTASPEDRERLGRLQTLYAQMEDSQTAYETADTEEGRTKAFSAAQEQANAFREEMLSMQKHLENQGLLFDAKVDRRDTGSVIRHLKFAKDAVREGLAADRSTQEGQEKYATGRRAVHGHIRNVEDAIAKFMADPVTMMRMGEESLKSIESLRNAQQDMQTLAVEEFDGDLMQAFNSTKGQKILAEQEKAMALLHRRVEDPNEQYKYLGNAEQISGLRDIAGRLFKAGKLSGGSLEDLLNLNDEQLSQRMGSGELTADEMSTIKIARDKREGIREKYNDLADSYRVEGSKLLEQSLTSFTGDAGLAEQMLDSDAGKRVAHYLQGTGVGNLHMRAWLHDAADAAKSYHDPKSRLTDKERDEMRKRYGVALDVFRSDKEDAGAAADPEELMTFLEKKMRDTEREHGDNRGKEKEGGAKHFSIGRLTVHGDGRAEMELTEEDPQGT